MSNRSEEQKRVESWFLMAARDAGVPIPPGEFPDEEPDFRFQTENCTLGVELTEVLRPESSNHGILPVEEEKFHREIIQAAQRDYYRIPNAKPVHASVYFANASGKRRNKQEMACALSKFVQSIVHRANPVASSRDVPGGFSSVTVIATSNPEDWWSGEVGGVSLAEIRPQVEARIAEKDKLIDKYRSNLPEGAELWLLLYSGTTVSRSMPIPPGVEDWRVRFQFDRVFWFSALDHSFIEIQKT
jgi:hypothetical protein